MKTNYNIETNSDTLAEIDHLLGLLLQRQEHSGLGIGEKRKIASKVHNIVATALSSKGAAL